MHSTIIHVRHCNYHFIFSQPFMVLFGYQFGLSLKVVQIQTLAENCYKF